MHFFERIESNADYRSKIFLLLSTLFNTAYSAFLLFNGVFLSSKWLLVTAIYYGMLAIVRLFILFHILKNKNSRNYRREIFVYRICGWFLLVLNAVISVLIFFMIFKTPPVPYNEIIVITLATYTFTTMTIAIIGNVKRTKNDDFVHSSRRIINLISSCVSMVTLTNTMIATFGDGEENFRNIILSIIGVAVGVFIITVSVYMIIKANERAKEVKNEK